MVVFMGVNSLNKYIQNTAEKPTHYAPYGKPQESVETDLASYTTFISQDRGVSVSLLNTLRQNEKVTSSESPTSPCPGLHSLDHAASPAPWLSRFIEGWGSLEQDAFRLKRSFF